MSWPKRKRKYKAVWRCRSCEAEYATFPVYREVMEDMAFYIGHLKPCQGCGNGVKECIAIEEVS